MIRKLKDRQIQELVNLPESGMGYQFIEAETGYFSTRSKYLVLNSELIIEDSGQIINEVKNIFRNDYRSVLFSANEIELKNIRLIENLSYTSIKNFSVTANTGAIHQKEEYASGNEIFTRLSAYENDKRIDFINKKLMPGSYTTTFADYDFCKKNNLDPVDRYALPNDEAIKWVFHIQPISTDKLQRGIVEPAYNHKGGGIEAYFKNGTSNKTYLGNAAY